MPNENVSESQNQQSCQTSVICSPKELEPILAKIEHYNDLGLSTWYEVVYFDEKWRSYAGSKTFQDCEKVVKWKYVKDCLNEIIIDSFNVVNTTLYEE